MSAKTIYPIPADLFGILSALQPGHIAKVVCRMGQEHGEEFTWTVISTACTGDSLALTVTSQEVRPLGGRSQGPAKTIHMLRRTDKIKPIEIGKYCPTYCTWTDGPVQPAKVWPTTITALRRLWADMSDADKQLAIPAYLDAKGIKYYGGTDPKPTQFDADTFYRDYVAKPPRKAKLTVLPIDAADDGLRVY